jgi:hypothetical protein
MERRHKIPETLNRRLLIAGIDRELFWGLCAVVGQLFLLLMAIQGFNPTTMISAVVLFVVLWAVLYYLAGDDSLYLQVLVESIRQCDHYDCLRHAPKTIRWHKTRERYKANYR